MYVEKYITILAEIVVSKGDRTEDSHTQQLSLKSHCTFGCPLRRSIDKAELHYHQLEARMYWTGKVLELQESTEGAKCWSYKA